jgi:hypothetical protein
MVSKAYAASARTGSRGGRVVPERGPMTKAEPAEGGRGQGVRVRNSAAVTAVGWARSR